MSAQPPPPAREATRAQVAAADPRRSTWVSANAGSGKTRVLTDRVARLLLAGTPPERILCLTYTKAAAANMHNTLVDRLGKWAMLPDTELEEALTALGTARDDLSAGVLRRARTLFAAALETPGGLKIQTIHAFCASILRRFPLEAGVSPRFSEIDERSYAILESDVLEAIAEGPDAAALDALAEVLGGTAIRDVLAGIRANRAGFAGQAEAELRAALGLPPDLDVAGLVGSVWGPGLPALIARLRAVLAEGSTNDQKALGKLARFDATQPDPAGLAVLEDVFLFKTGQTPGAPRFGKFPTSAAANLLSEGERDELHALMQRVADMREARMALAVLERSLVLHRFAKVFLAEVEAQKAARGWLDFDDLIDRTRHLLADSPMAQWVLYRLDGGIDHILVDEAQDTSPAQWEVIRRLSEEFLAGQGARAGIPRGLFVVGDEKQSIYSFQGADPVAFARMRDHFDDFLRNGGAGLNRGALLYSFRSAQQILRLVDMTFVSEQTPGVAAEIQHMAFHEQMDGRVDLWPLVPKPEKPEAGNWEDPLDMPGRDDPNAILAGLLADQIARWLDEAPLLRRPNGTEAPLEAGDIMILVQRRSGVFHPIIRALKARNLPVAGADRLKVGAELAVRDLRALLAFLAQPEDALSLAAVLRSPLCGLDEAALFRLASGRQSEGLWQRVRSAGPETLPHGVRAMLDDLRTLAGYERPHEILMRTLTVHGGRERLLARLGPEAEEGIDALLAQALDFERSEVPGLTSFLVWLDAVEDDDVKREAEARGGLIRVMTVHGAKGLEAPMVILPDTQKRRANADSAPVLPLESGLPILAALSGEAPGAQITARSARATARREENDRLLYVAMTRAECWLVVCGVGDAGAPGESWHATVAAGMEAAGAVARETPAGTGLGLGVADWAHGTAAPARAAVPVALPGWVGQPAPAAPRAAPLRAPSDLGGAKVMPGDPSEAPEPGARAEALRRGRVVHRLLELLPSVARGDWPALAAQIADAEGLGAHVAGEMLAEARSVLDAPALAPIFGPESLAEAGITAQMPDGAARLLGYVDRLVITSERVLAVDFKTNILVPERPQDVPDGLLRQMAAYAHALGAVWPGRRVETALLWTRTAQLMVLPHDLVTAARTRLGDA